MNMYIAKVNKKFKTQAGHRLIVRRYLVDRNFAVQLLTGKSVKGLKSLLSTHIGFVMGYF